MTSKSPTSAARGAPRTTLDRLAAPDLSLERRLCKGDRVVAGMDEVGRGAWAGPVVVGVVAVDATVGELPDGVQDSKAMTAASRTALAPTLRNWCTAWALGTASADEIDRLGIVAALTVASHRALVALPVRPDVVLLDGTIDFITGARLASPHSPRPGRATRVTTSPEVRTVVRGDSSVGTVAAAAILAKVSRDAAMVRLSGRVRGYGFDQHKGYGTRAHEHAIQAMGLTVHHRRSWSFVERLDASLSS